MDESRTPLRNILVKAALLTSAYALAFVMTYAIIQMILYRSMVNRAIAMAESFGAGV